MNSTNSEFSRLLYEKAALVTPRPKHQDPGPVEAYEFSPDRLPKWSERGKKAKDCNK